MTKTKLALFASGGGSNALNIIDYFSTSSTVELEFVLSNKKEAPVVELAKEKGVEVLVFTNEEVANGALLTEICTKRGIDYIILAGYLRKIPFELLENYTDKMLNVHPALLPKHGGKGMYGKFVHEAVLKEKDTETGITFHFVNEHFDEGRILAQFQCSVSKDDTLDTIQEKIQLLEHVNFPSVIEKMLNGSF